ncbi:molybdopterin synthase sulfur carrier subunit isoform X2 [Ceratina calcarata]|uniref:Molybdopterin synthase sulfur carrier subunit isoform X2 n=1 Tax=Ceratina calcarata TaxID=156304 RepID=A0AAJ7S500_9HYME|nr:molybdopterin synthase sulfur carrier subunit isoform X2 [Ceratina calcarata]
MDDGVVETKVKILFFAKAREITGRKEAYITVPQKLSYTDLKNKVIGQFDLQVIRDTLILAVNEAFVSSDAIVEFTENDEIAVIPPLSGG